MSLTGVNIITLTPFDEEGNIDETSLRRLTDFYIDAGVHGMTILGIMGEAHKLTTEERQLVIDITVEQTQGKVPVIVGCTADGTILATELAKNAEKSGADGVMIAAPRNLNNEAMLFEHFADISKEISIPIIVQDEPVTTGVKMSAELLAKLADEIENVKYVKLEETPTTVKTTKILELTDNMKIFGGLGGVYFYEELDRGAIGIMTGFAYPEVLIKVHDLFFDNQADAAKEYFYKMLPLIRFEAQLGIGGVTIRKEAFKLRGIIDTSHVRKPGQIIDEKTMQELEEIINHLEL